MVKDCDQSFYEDLLCGVEYKAVVRGGRMKS